jgi:hypothetical protein
VNLECAEVGLAPGKKKLTLSIKEETLALLDQHVTPRKRAETIEALILKEYAPKEQSKETAPAPAPPQPQPQAQAEEEQVSSQVTVVVPKKEER